MKLPRPTALQVEFAFVALVTVVSIALMIEKLFGFMRSISPAR